jgi:hypothetical protein
VRWRKDQAHMGDKSPKATQKKNQQKKAAQAKKAPK